MEKKTPPKDLKKRKNIKALNVEIEKSGALLKESLRDLNQTQKETVQTLKSNKILSYILLGVLVAILFGGYYWYDSSKPRTGSMAFGICHNFLELNVQFPDYLRLASVSSRSPSKGVIAVRIWYSQLDGYGQTRMEKLECFFRKSKSGTVLDGATIDTREIDKETIHRFNVALPAITKTELDRNLPSNFSNRIRDLKFDQSKMRKRYF